MCMLSEEVEEVMIESLDILLSAPHYPQAYKSQPWLLLHILNRYGSLTGQIIFYCILLNKVMLCSVPLKS